MNRLAKFQDETVDNAITVTLESHGLIFRFVCLYTHARHFRIGCVLDVCVCVCLQLFIAQHLEPELGMQSNVTLIMPRTATRHKFVNI